MKRKLIGKNENQTEDIIGGRLLLCLLTARKPSKLRTRGCYRAAGWDYVRPTGLHK